MKLDTQTIWLVMARNYDDYNVVKAVFTTAKEAEDEVKRLDSIPDIDRHHEERGCVYVSEQIEDAL